jgi:hypothetical protein
MENIASQTNLLSMNAAMVLYGICSITEVIEQV